MSILYILYVYIVHIFCLCYNSLFSKIVIKVMVPKATMACQDDQLCARLKAVMNITIHGVQALWDKNLSSEEWGF